MTTAPDMKIKGIAPWFGGKRTLAPEIVAELGPHRAYWEPFCGSAAVLLAKAVSSSETINDLNGDLINLARVLADEATAVALYNRLMRFVMHEEIFHEAAARWRARGRQPSPELPDIDLAADFMVCSWFGRNGVGTSSYNQGFCVSYTVNGAHAATRWRSTVDSIPAWHHRLRCVTILNRDAFALLERIEDARGTSIYIDSPYIEKGAKYIHDFAAEDHRRLATSLSRFERARVIVSYYDHPVVRKLYDGWTLRHLKATKAMVSQGTRGKGGAVAAPEVLLINGPSFVESNGPAPLQAELFERK